MLRAPVPGLPSPAYFITNAWPSAAERESVAWQTKVEERVPRSRLCAKPGGLARSAGEFAQNNVSDPAPDHDAIHVSAAEMDAAPDTRVFDFPGKLGKRVICACDAEWTGRGHADLDGIAAEKTTQDRFRSAGKNGMRGRVLRMWRRHHKRLPTGITLQPLDVGRGRGANGGDWPPVRVLVLLLERDDLRICGRHRKYGEQAGVFRERQAP